MAFTNPDDKDVTYTPDKFDGRMDYHIALKRSNAGMPSILVQVENGEMNVSIELDPKKQGLKKQVEEMLQQAGVTNARAMPSYDGNSSYVAFETKDPKQIMAALGGLIGNPAKDELGVIAPNEAAKIAGILVEQGVVDPQQSGYASFGTVAPSNGIALRDIKFQQSFMGIQAVQENTRHTGSNFLGTELSSIGIIVSGGQESARVLEALRKNRYEVDLSSNKLGLYVKSHPEQGKFNFNSVVETLANEGMLPDTVAKMAKEHVSQVPQATVQSSFMTAPAQKAAVPIPQAPRQNVGGLNR